MKTNDFSDFKFRCSGLGNLVSASGKFTDHNKTYVEEVHVGAVHNIQKDISSKYFEKGIMCEMDGVDFIKKMFYPNDYLHKNKNRFENEFIHGEPDLIVDFDKTGYEIKNAYDLFTFGKASLSHNYMWQMIGYAWVTGITRWRLVYVLDDMPDILLEKEENKLFYSMGLKDRHCDEWIEAKEKLHKKYDFTYLSIAERVKFWEIEATIDHFNRITTAVNNGRKYMHDLEIERLSLIEQNLKKIEQSKNRS